MTQISIFQAPPFVECAAPDSQICTGKEAEPKQADGRWLMFWLNTADDGTELLFATHPNPFTPEWCYTHRKAFGVRCNECEVS